MPEWCEREEPSGRRRVPRFARHYDPQLGRFYSIDPLPSASSPYEYCGGNPLRYADPSGMTIERLPFIDAEFEYNGNPLTGGGAYGGGYDPFRGYDKCYRNFHGGQGGGAGLNWGSRDVNGATVFYAYHVSRLADASGQSYSTESLAWGMALGTHRFEQAMLRAWMYAEFGRGPAPTLDPGVRMNNRTLYVNMLTFDRASSTLTVQYGAEMQVFNAANNALGNGPWPRGMWEFKQWRPDEDRWFNENSDVGGSGFFQFDLSSTTDPKRTLMGIHAGRMDKGGYTWWTHGCIRTTPVGSSYLFDIYHGSGSLPPLFVH